MRNHEIRTIQATELRAEGDAERRVLRGYAAVFNVLSEDLGGFREKIAPGAFKGSLGDDVKALWDHCSSMVLGRTTNGSLKLAEDEKGLLFELHLPSTSAARDAYELVARGDVSGCSFGFMTLKDSWISTEDQKTIRTLEAVKLYEISMTAFPAYPQTDAAVRSLEQWRAAQPWRPSLAQRRRRAALAAI